MPPPGFATAATAVNPRDPRYEFPVPLCNEGVSSARVDWPSPTSLPTTSKQPSFPESSKDAQKGLRTVKNLRHALLALTVAVSAFAGAPVLVTGAGSTFITPMFSKWFAEYGRLHPDVQFSYQSVGSGAGVRDALERKIDFGASDAPCAALRNPARQPSTPRSPDGPLAPSLENTTSTPSIVIATQAPPQTATTRRSHAGSISWTPRAMPKAQ